MKKVIFGIAVCCVALFGCQRNDMWYQAKARTYSESDFFPNHQTARPLIAGTVPRGHLDDDDFLYKGTQNSQPATMFPFTVTKDVLERGQERYNIYCSPCHSRSGNGLGMIVQRGYPEPESFHTDKLRAATPGYFYSVLMNGYGVTNKIKVQNANGTSGIQEDFIHPAIATKSSAEDRWAIIAYIRALQRSQHATIDDVPAEERTKMDQTGKENAHEG